MKKIITNKIIDTIFKNDYHGFKNQYIKNFKEFKEFYKHRLENIKHLVNNNKKDILDNVYSDDTIFWMINIWFIKNKSIDLR